MKSQRWEARTLEVGCQVRGRILLHESFEHALCRCADAHLEGHQEIFSFQCEEGFSWRKQGDMGGYPTGVLSNDGEAMRCVSISLERLQKDKAVTVSVDRGRRAAQALKSHGAGKLGLFSEHLHAVRRKGFKYSAWIGIRTSMPCSAEAEDPLRWGKSVPNQARCRFVLMANQL